MTAPHRPGPPAQFPLDRWLPIDRAPAPYAERRYPVPNVLQNGAEPGTDAIWDAAAARAAQQRPGEMAICRACGRLTQIYARGVCRADYDRYTRGEIQEHVLAPALPPIAPGTTVPLAHPVAGVLTLDPEAAPRAEAPPPRKRPRALRPRKLERALQAPTDPPTPAPVPAPEPLPPTPPPKAPIFHLEAGAPVAEVPQAPRRRSLDRLIADLVAARADLAALSTTIADLEAEIRSRLPADLLPQARSE